MPDPVGPTSVTTSDDLGEPTRAWLLTEANRLLDAARAAAVRAHPAGAAGFGWLDGLGRLDPTHGRPLWITTRMVHCLALGHLLGR